MRRTTLIQSAALSVLALSTIATIWAAEKPVARPQYMILTTYHVKPSADADFADLLKNRWMPAMKKAGGSPTIYSTSPAGGRAGTYIIASPVGSLAVFDAESTLTKGAGAVEAARIIAQRNLQIEDRSVTILRRREEMSVYAATPQNSPLLLLQRVKVAPGKREDFIALWNSTVLPAVKKSGRFVSTWSVILGDDSELHMTTPLTTYGELDKGYSVAKMSMPAAEYDAFNIKVGPLYSNVRREVLRLRTDLMDPK